VSHARPDAHRPISLVVSELVIRVMVTAPYAFYTKEAIDRLIAIWCENVIAVIKEQPQNVVSK
ncbi:MAG: hypothetical protein K2H20_01730, partial [Bacilli bacterium]|nr:hypothetical protein [Bacilli bacterium]